MSTITAEAPSVTRPWGGYTILKKNHSLWVKKLYIQRGQRLSLQSHQQRNEVWVVLRGEVEAQIGNRIYSAQPDDVIVVPKNRKHRISGVTDACIMEFAYGTVLEHDIIRYSDDYGRAPATEKQRE